MNFLYSTLIKYICCAPYMAFQSSRFTRKLPIITNPSDVDQHYLHSTEKAKSTQFYLKDGGHMNADCEKQ